MKQTAFFLFSILCFYFVCCDDIEVDLSSNRPDSKTSVFKKYGTLSDTKTKIKIKNINEDVGFFIIQVHSYIENVTLSYNSTVSLHSHVTGTNVGLVYASVQSRATFYVFRNKKITEDAPIVLIITVYDVFDPIPGGCNLSFVTNKAPYQIVSYTDDYILVESQPPSAYGVKCDENKIKIDMYHLYLAEYDNTMYTYFDSIDKMVTVDSIKSYGRKVTPGNGYFKYRRLYSSYKGTGEIFAIIATYNNRSSAYVPAVSYGCDLMNWDTDCIGPVTDFWKVICAILLIFGLFTCFIGHRFFRFTLFTIGFTFGVLITYLAISFDGNFAVQEKMITSLIIGFFYGVIWVFIWWKYGVPLLSVHLTFVLAGILVASIVFYAGLADIIIYTSDLNFWITFLCLVVACLLIWSPATMYGHIFGCSLLGSYAFVIALNYYVGGNMQYIMINTFRRATVKNFNMAIIAPPYHFIDILHTILWIFLVGMGCFVQLRAQRDKPPFPPHRNGVRLSNATSERTPLIPAENVNVPQYV